MKAKAILLFSLYVFMDQSLVLSQNKRDHNWIIGYDTAVGPEGEAIQLDFNVQPLSIANIPTIEGFGMEGSNTSMSDKDGNLLFYSNGCYIVNANHEKMVNGDTINPGLVQDFWCPFGGSPIAQGALSLPAPGSDSLYYIFNLNLDDIYHGTDFTPIAPVHLYYHLIDMSKGNGLGAVIAKNQIAVSDTLARGNIKAVQHANGVDWWLVVAKSHSNCYFVMLITEDGVKSVVLDCEGNEWNDNDSGYTVFSPDATKYARFNFQNGLHIFDFDNGTGELSNPVDIQFPNDTFPTNSGVSISPNSRYLYASARKKLYQFDLHASDIGASKIQVAEWDGFASPYATIFNFSALAPDGKIYIASTSSHMNLHVIHYPDCPGLQCNVEQHGIDLPSYNYVTIPNFPHYRNEPSGIDCDSVVSYKEKGAGLGGIKAFPNPTTGKVKIESSGFLKNAVVEIHDLLGRKIATAGMDGLFAEMDLGGYENGIYIYTVFAGGAKIANGKLLKLGH